MYTEQMYDKIKWEVLSNCIKILEQKKFLWSVEIYLKQEVIYARTNWKEIKIESIIYVVRGKQVKDLVKLHQCANDTKTINQTVKRYINRFPKRFRFQLTDE